MFRYQPGVKSQDHNNTKEMTAEADWNRGPSAYRPNALPLARPADSREDPSLRGRHSWQQAKHMKLCPDPLQAVRRDIWTQI